MTYRVVVVGLNHYHVSGWVESLAQFSEQIEVVARYDANPERVYQPAPEFIDPNLSQTFPEWMASVPFYSSIDAMLRDSKPDIALVTLPNSDAPVAIELLARNGTHLLVDKPGAIGARDAESAFGAVRRAGVKTAVAFTRRYGRAWQEAERAIRSDRLGKLLSAESFFVTGSVAVRDPANVIFKRELMGGGILHWLGVHDVDLLLWLSGESVVEVQAMTANVGCSNIDVEDTISVAFRFESGAMGTMHFSYALPRSYGEGFVAFHGLNASLRIESSGKTEWLGPGTVRDPLLQHTSTFESRAFPGYGSVGTRIIDDLLQSIESDREPLATGDHATAALQVIDAIYEAAKSGERVIVRQGEPANQ
jgi:UDP-N-acetyl-2-amino-2-deoxyglucuronate dehydrogenase